MIYLYLYALIAALAAGFFLAQYTYSHKSFLSAAACVVCAFLLGVLFPVTLPLYLFRDY